MKIRITRCAVMLFVVVSVFSGCVTNGKNTMSTSHSNNNKSDTVTEKSRYSEIVGVCDRPVLMSDIKFSIPNEALENASGTYLARIVQTDRRFGGGIGGFIGRSIANVSVDRMNQANFNSCMKFVTSKRNVFIWVKEETKRYALVPTKSYNKNGKGGEKLICRRFDLRNYTVNGNVVGSMDYCRNLQKGEVWKFDSFPASNWEIIDQG